MYQEKNIRIKNKILKSTFNHIHINGWSGHSMLLGCSDVGVSRDQLNQLFPEGIDELIDHYFLISEQSMIRQLSKINLDNMRIRDKISLGVNIRLRKNYKHKEPLKRLYAVGILKPQKLLPKIWKTSDLIWKIAGDNSTDHNYYTKRALLSWVYLSTLTYWLDESDNALVEAFLERRINEVLFAGGKFNKIVTSLKTRSYYMNKLLEKLGNKLYKTD